MDAVAFPDPAVVTFISTHFIPLRLAADDPQWGPAYGIKWTPSLLLLNADGKEEYRTLGFFPPDELIPSLCLGLGKAFFNQARRVEAIEKFNHVINEFPASFAVQEAIFLHGVANYIESHDVSHLIGIYDRLHTLDPNGAWAMRADPYRLLRQS